MCDAVAAGLCENCDNCAERESCSCDTHCEAYDDCCCSDCAGKQANGEQDIFECPAEPTTTEEQAVDEPEAKEPKPEPEEQQPEKQEPANEPEQQEPANAPEQQEPAKEPEDPQPKPKQPVVPNDACPDFADPWCGGTCPQCEQASKCNCDQYCSTLGDCCCDACQGLDADNFDGYKCPQK